MSDKITIDDIFDDDEYGLLNSVPPKSVVKSSDDRLIDSFEEINVFVDNNQREPGGASMSEYGLMARLKALRDDESKKRTLKPFDRHDLLGVVEMEKLTIDDVFDDDPFGLLNTDKELTIFEYRNIPHHGERAESDFIAQRKAMKEKDFAPYEAMFQRVHQEIKAGRRKLKSFNDAERNLKAGNYYIVDGVMLYLESANTKKIRTEHKSGSRWREEGRTKTIFENGTYSNMLFRSLGKRLIDGGKIITAPDDIVENELMTNANIIEQEDVPTGWIYVLRSQSFDPKISAISDLHKIGVSSIPVEDRIKNARNEATYLYADVRIVSSYACYNMNAAKLELLLHRFFASSCLNIDLYAIDGQRISPREWFVVPLNVIEEAIKLVMNGNIIRYMYDPHTSTIVRKGKT